MNNVTKQIILAELQNKNEWVFKRTYDNKNTRNPLNATVLSRIKDIRKIPSTEPNQFVYSWYNRYVVKLVQFKRPTDKESFKNEIRIGFEPNVSSFGVNVHAYKESTFRKWVYGIYIMDHVTYGKDLTAVTLYKYMNDDSTQMDVVERHLFHKLKLFYKITGGFHGDLHAKNIIVLYKMNTVVSVRIIDYGNFVPFDKLSYNRIKKLNIRTNIREYARIVHHAFDSHNNTRNMFNGIRIRYKRSGLPFRSNQAMLNGLNLLYIKDINIR